MAEEGGEDRHGQFAPDSWKNIVLDRKIGIRMSGFICPRIEVTFRMRRTKHDLAVTQSQHEFRPRWASCGRNRLKGKTSNNQDTKVRARARQWLGSPPRAPSLE